MHEELRRSPLADERAFAKELDRLKGLHEIRQNPRIENESWSAFLARAEKMRGKKKEEAERYIAWRKKLRTKLLTAARYVAERCEFVGYTAAYNVQFNADGTADALVRIVGFSDESGRFEHEYTRLMPHFEGLPIKMPAGVRVKLSWRVQATEETCKYLRVIGGLPTIRSKYWGRHKAAQLFWEASETAAIIDDNEWTVEMMILHLRFDANWLRKTGPKPKKKKSEKARGKTA